MLEPAQPLALKKDHVEFMLVSTTLLHKWGLVENTLKVMRVGLTKTLSGGWPALLVAPIASRLLLALSPEH